HLHFEVRSANSASAYKDPFAGGCNTLNTSSWWATQKPYTEPAVLKAQIGNMDPVLASCPNTETPNESPCLQPGSDARIYVFLRDETQGMVVNIKIKDSTGNVVLSWPLTSAQTQLASIYGWQQRMPTQQGSYTLEASYNNTTSVSSFEITTAQCRVASSTGIAEADNANAINVYPNPTSGRINISSTGLAAGTYDVTLHDMLGQEVMQNDMIVSGTRAEQTISVSGLMDGIYLLSIQGNGTTLTRKIQKATF
ncbi:MAG: T9SS type A sorting domain-containing protein, partial [Bacteroidetes bacterium]|nr:T9SS type A sorting domain-containing protein [Bacteroidota bacterium]